MGAKLTLVLTTSPNGGSPRGETRLLETGSLTVGRGPDNDWILADPERHLSKQHCEIAFTGAAFVLTDTSTNGVFLNGAGQSVGRGGTVVLNQGDVLRLGGYELRASIDDGLARDDVVDYQRDAASWPEFEEKTYYGSGSPDDRAQPDNDAGGWGGGVGGAGDPFDDDLSDWNDDPIRPAKRVGPPATPSDHIPSERDSMPIQRVTHQAAPQVLGTDWDDDLDAILGDAPLSPGGGGGNRLPPSKPPSPQGRQQAPAFSQGHSVGVLDDLDSPLGDDPFGAEPLPPVRKASQDNNGAAPDLSAKPRADADPFAADDGGSSASGGAHLPAPSPRGDLRPSLPPASPPVSPSKQPAEAGMEADAQALVSAFLRGAGLPGLPSGQSSEAMMEAAGALLAVMTDGVRDLLAARATLKSEMRAEQTMIRARGNNALKFSVNAQEALDRLLGPPGGAYMDGKAAAEEAFRDLRGHEIATMAGSSAAIRAVLAAFDPEALENKLEGRHGGLGGLLSGGRRARLWELYEGHYRELADEAVEDFDSRFNREFRKAYEKLVKDL